MWLSDEDGWPQTHTEVHRLEGVGYEIGYLKICDKRLPFYLTGLFDILAVAITTSTQSVTELLAPGDTTFDAVFGTTYFANVLGLTDDDFGAGLFGIKIAPVPIPPSLILLGSSVLGLVLLRRRVR